MSAGRFAVEDISDKFMYFPTPLPNFFGFGRFVTVAGTFATVSEIFCSHVSGG